VICNSWPANFRLGFFVWYHQLGRIIRLERSIVAWGLGNWTAGVGETSWSCAPCNVVFFVVFNTPDRSPCSSGNITADLTSLQALANAPGRFRWCHNFRGSQGPPIDAHGWNPGAQHLIQDINYDAERDGLQDVLLLNVCPLC
jgi:hypothetical protein